MEERERERMGQRGGRLRDKKRERGDDSDRWEPKTEEKLGRDHDLCVYIPEAW